MLYELADYFNLSKKAVLKSIDEININNKSIHIKYNTEKV